MAITRVFGLDTIQTAQVTVIDDKTMTSDDAGIAQNIATDAKTFTLPLIDASLFGVPFIFRNNGADAAVGLTLSPNALDGINGSCASGTGANADATTADGLISKASGVINKNWVNTKATANTGDYIVLTPVALTKWFVTSGVGVWASEA